MENNRKFIKKKIDIIIPVFNEEQNIRPIFNEIRRCVEKISKYKWGYIFVNDGSDDGSLEVLKDLAKSNKGVKVIDLTRNFGKEIALTAGLDHSYADAAIFLDADLQHPPKLIPKLIDKWEKGALIVSTIRKNIKKQPIIRRMGSAIFYWIINRISDVKFIPKTTDFKLLDKKIINILKSFTERNRMFRGLIDWIGYKSDYIEFKAPERTTGKARYSYRKLINLAINSITSFSLKPLKLAGFLGLGITFMATILFIIMIIVKFILKSSFFSSLSFIIVGNTILIGIVLISLGFIALYIGQIHAEVINRPLYIVKEKINIDE